MPRRDDGTGHPGGGPRGSGGPEPAAGEEEQVVVRIWRTAVAEGREEEYERFARDVSLPMFRRHEGFAGVVMGRQGPDRVVVTLWRSAADAQALETSADYRGTVERILAAGFLLDVRETETFESHLVDLPGPA